MPKFRYDKLVRDKIPEYHENSGHTVEGRILGGVALRRALIGKLHEEVDEAGAAPSKKKLTEEIADIRQILDDLCAKEGILEIDVKTAQAAKEERKGGFREGRYIETVTIPDENDEWAQYCRKSPDKYPEEK